MFDYVHYTVDNEMLFLKIDTFKFNQQQEVKKKIFLFTPSHIYIKVSMNMFR